MMMDIKLTASMNYILSSEYYAQHFKKPRLCKHQPLATQSGLPGYGQRECQSGQIRGVTARVTLKQDYCKQSDILSPYKNKNSEMVVRKNANDSCQDIMRIASYTRSIRLMSKTNCSSKSYALLTAREHQDKQVA